MSPLPHESAPPSTEPMRVSCPTCGVVDEDLSHAESEIRRLRRKVGKLEAELADERKENPNQALAYRLYELWHSLLGKNGNTTYDGKREKMLLAIIAHYERQPDIDTEAFLSRAILGLSKRPFVGPLGRVAEGTRKQRYDDLKYAVQDAASVERFAGYADADESPDTSPSPLSGLPSRRRVEALAFGFYRSSGGMRENFDGDMRALWVNRVDAALAFARSFEPLETPAEGCRVEFPAPGPLELRNVLEAFADRGLKVVGQGAQFKGQCPLGDRHANGDRTPSCSVTEKPDGRVLLNCFGCGAGHLELARALDLYRRGSGRAGVGQGRLEEAA